MGSQNYIQLLIFCPPVESTNLWSIKILVLMHLHLLPHQRWSLWSIWKKKWLYLPKSAIHVWSLGIYCPSVSNVTRQAIVGLQLCISDPKHQELAMHLHFGKDFLTISRVHLFYLVAIDARKQPSSCMLILRINCSVTSSPAVRISLQSLLNLKPPVEPGTDCYQVSIMVSSHLFYGQLLIHYPLQWICNNRIYNNVVQNVLLVVLHVPLLLMC